MPTKQVKVDKMIYSHSFTYPSQQFAKSTVHQGIRLLKPSSSELLVTTIREELHCRHKSTVHQELRCLKPPSSELHSDLRTKIQQYNNNIYTQIATVSPPRHSNTQFELNFQLFN